MKCNDAAEFVSALCDSLTIPSAAARHINGCKHCRRLLLEYAEMGAEVRRVASLEISEAHAPWFQPVRRGLPARLWQTARSSMRLPRLAFVSLLIAVMVMGSGWARQIVRAASHGSVLLVQFNTGEGPLTFCSLSAVDKKLNGCGGMQKVKAGILVWQVQVLSKQGNRAILGTRAEVHPDAGEFTTNVIDNLPQQKASLIPGQTLSVPVHGFGPMKFTGEWIDHVPAVAVGRMGENSDLDPGPHEVRFISPLLLEGHRVVGDLEGASTSIDKSGSAIDLYLKDAGRFDLSPSPIPSGVQGKVNFNRISFTLDGHSYVFVTGAPISRSSTMWISHTAPQAGNASNRTSLGVAEIRDLVSARAQR